MKRISSIILLLAFTLTAAGCSRGNVSTSFGGIFEKLKKARDFSEAKQCYTDGTIDAIESAVSGGVIGEKERLRILPLFNEKTTWDELSRKVDGSRGSIRIRYTGHPVENMIGSEMDFRLRKEGGSWKVDLEDEIRQALKGRERGSAAEYIQRIKRKY
ncbi:MAG TPA: hypothetical protein PLM53_09980 [Spirochaetota bacterium]|nr:hypothetical protein [Spirochaetota bacterium]HPC41089.1 hypothetical protein [Spirochaetota bacterium]HPL16975.1 hypothetical protein [Spirochaetota bacterium]HQF08798.1 hypothetical protein [Spirochaetota bacterium]HQH97417.1 hypothetical protein [Spirochaetota bacterium]